MAKSTSENSTHAMIVGVATHPLYRNKGYATKEDSAGTLIIPGPAAPVFNIQPPTYAHLKYNLRYLPLYQTSDI
mgnify:CR=1 FL=1